MPTTPGPHYACHCSYQPNGQSQADRQTHTHPLNGPFSGTTQVSWYQKGTKTNLDFTEARGSGISWATCKSAPRSSQITMPAPHHSVFYSQMHFLPPNQLCQSTEGNRQTDTMPLNRHSSGQTVRRTDTIPLNRHSTGQTVRRTDTIPLNRHSTGQIVRQTDTIPLHRHSPTEAGSVDNYAKCNKE